MLSARASDLQSTYQLHKIAVSNRLDSVPIRINQANGQITKDGRTHEDEVIRVKTNSLDNVLVEEQLQKRHVIYFKVWHHVVVLLALL